MLIRVLTLHPPKIKISTDRDGNLISQDFVIKSSQLKSARIVMETRILLHCYKLV
uniref:hypothetical protein n=1 Tax=Methanocaldococcus vulcanius TaxID=73913 RepID=UPI0012930A33|nr:hypothetical protein [Methanocaldococcus vulcanius]